MLKDRNGRTIILPTETPYGVKEYRTEIGVMVVDVNYRADPWKRNDSWVRDAKVGKPKKVWQREFEGDWSVAEGTPVAGEFKKEKHVSASPLHALPHVTVTIGWDFGFSPAAVFGQKHEQGQILRALHPKQENLYQFGARVLANMYTREQLMEFFPHERCQALSPPMTFSTLFNDKLFEGVVSLSEQAGQPLAFRHVGDPAGRSRNANDGESPFQLLRRVFGINVTAKANNWGMRVNALDTAFMEGAEVSPGVPLVMVSGSSDCDFLVEGLAGAYAYPEVMTGKEEPPKGPYSHPQDALQYVLMDWFPVGSNRAVSAMQSENYGAALGGASPPKPSAEEGSTVPAVAVSMIKTGENGLKTFEGAWNPFLQSMCE